MNYPKEYVANRDFRLNILLKAENDKDAQALIIDQCKNDRLFFINTFLWTYDPRTKLKHLPFLTYPFQDDFLRWDAKCAEEQIDNCIEKSRDMGVTWLCVANDYYDWLFARDRLEIRWGSRKKMFVDNIGDMDSIFEKFRYLISKSPRWMLPVDWNWNLHANSMRLVNPDTGSIISGESTNDNFGRGGRKYRVRFDEFAFWECDKNAWEGTADVTNCRSAISTPCGASNQFAKIAFSNIAKKTLHWTLHPNKAKNCYYFDASRKRVDVTQEEAFPLWQKGTQMHSDWYDREVGRRQNDVAVAQELDIDYERSEGSMLLKMSEIKACVGLNYHYEGDKRYISVDASREGKDQTVIKVFYNLDVIETTRLNHVDNMSTVGLLLTMQKKHKATAFIVDRGEGAGIIDRLREVMYEDDSKIKVFEVKYGERANQHDKYFNRRAEMYFYTRDKILGKMIPVEDDNVLMNQLSSIPYEYASDTRWKLKKKDEIRSLMGCSPDDADCFVQGIFYEQYVPLLSFSEQARDYQRFMPQSKKGGNSYGWKKGVKQNASRS